MWIGVIAELDLGCTRDQNRPDCADQKQWAGSVLRRAMGREREELQKDALGGAAMHARIGKSHRDTQLN